jgi:hypothetical protein
VKVGSAAAASCGKCAEVCNAEPLLQMQWADEEFESSNGPVCSANYIVQFCRKHWHVTSSIFPVFR